MDEGEVKTKIASQKVALLQGAVPQSRSGELEQTKRGLQQDWQSFVDSLKSTKYVPNLSVYDLIKGNVMKFCK